MYHIIVEFLPIPVLMYVVSVSWKVSKKFTTTDLKLDQVVEKVDRLIISHDELGQRVASVEGN